MPDIIISQDSLSIDFEQVALQTEVGTYNIQCTFRPNVGHKIKHSFASTVGKSIISQLRTGYVGLTLNEYLHKTEDFLNMEFAFKYGIREFLIQ